MNGTRNNNLIVIENGQLRTYMLDDKLEWEVGRPSKENKPDIKLYSATVSRRHGRFQNMDGVWFYLDYYGKNGTVLNNKHLEAGMQGRKRPVMLKDGDIFIFGGGMEAVINSKTIWAWYSTKYYGEEWRMVVSRNEGDVLFSDGESETTLRNPPKGTIVEKEKGLAIYMGNVTYLLGEMCVNGR